MTKSRITGLVAATLALVLSVLTFSGDSASATVICPSSGATQTYVIPPRPVAGGAIGSIVCVTGSGGYVSGSRALGVNANVTRLCVVITVLGFPARTLACRYSYPLWQTPFVPASAYAQPGRGAQTIATQAFHDGTYTLSASVRLYP